MVLQHRHPPGWKSPQGDQRSPTPEGLDLLHYVSGQITYVTDAEFEALLAPPVPEDVVHIDRNMTLGEMDHSRSPLGWVAQKVLRCRLDNSFARHPPGHL